MTDAAENYIKGHNKKSVVICDRGLMDGKAYCSQENWQKIMEKVNVMLMVFVDQGRGNQWKV
jgi:hypothetical protein